MQYSMYAFIPFGILLALALTATCISHWPKARRAKMQPAPLPIAPRPSAEILYFPPRLAQSPIKQNASLRRSAEG